MATGGLYGNSTNGALVATSGSESSGLYGNSPTGALVAEPGAESSGLYGNGTSFGGTYFEWFIFQEAETQPATPTGGSWSFQTNTGTPPTGWTLQPPANPVNQVWVSIALVNSRSKEALDWSEPGLFGVVPNFSFAPVITGAAGTNAAVVNLGTATEPNLQFTIPRGDKGDKGDTGDAATVDVGTTTTVSPSTPASVTNSGTIHAAILDFDIPQGEQGIQGIAATVNVGTTTTSAPGGNASVVNVGDENDAILNFTIPRGNPGPGVAAGGTTGQVLTKASNSDYDTTWGSGLPSQTGHANQFLTTDGTNPSWATVPDPQAATPLDDGLVYGSTPTTYDPPVNKTGFYMAIQTASLHSLEGYNSTSYSDSANNWYAGFAVGSAVYMEVLAGNGYISAGTYYLGVVQSGSSGATLFVSNPNNIATSVANTGVPPVSARVYHEGIGGNTFLGYSAGTTSTGTNNIVIGYDAEPSTAAANNEVTIGKSSNTNTRLFGSLSLNDSAGTSGQYLKSNGSGVAPTWTTLGSAAFLTAGAANGVATLDSGGTVPTSQLPASVLGAVTYQGTWNASTNTPTLTSSVGTKGYYYVVSVAGSTNLNGITDWKIGDWAIYSGTAWQKIDNTDAVTSVNGYTGTVVLSYTDVGAASAAQGTKADTALQTITSTDGSITVTPAGTTVNLAVSQDSPASTLLTQVRNTTGATLTKGTVVYISGATGQIATVTKAIATGDTTSAQTLGMITTDLPNNTNGYVTVFGLLSNLDTSAYTDGAQLYLSPTTAGTVTTTKPYAPYHLVYVGIVEYAHPTQGKVLVKVQNGYELDELHNVSAQTPSNGQTIVYNSSNQLWENNTVSLTAGVNGTLPIANGGTGATTASGALTSLGAYPSSNPNGYTNNLGTVTYVGAGTGLSGGPITSSGTLSLANTTVTPGSYTNASFTVDGQGRITAASSGAAGGVTSVTGTAPVTSSGGSTPAIGLDAGYGDTQNPYASKTANYFLAAPNGIAGAPTFRALVAADVPTLNQNTTGTASNVTGTVAVANGGTGSTTASGARTNLGATTIGGNMFTLTNPSAVTFPRFNADNTISALDSATFRTAIGAGTGNGTVTSIAMTVPTGLSVTGSPITTNGTFAITLTAGYSIPTDASQLNWNAAYTDRLNWDGGSTNLVAATGRTSLGATTVGSNMFTLTNPSAVTFPRFNADNTVSALDAATFRTAIGAGAGTVTSVTGTAPIASSGGSTPAISLNAGYGDTQNPYASKTANFVLAAPNGAAGAPTFRAIVAADIPTLNQNTTGTASNVTGTVAIANGGTGATTASAALTALGALPTAGGTITGALDVSGNYINGGGKMTYVRSYSVPTATNVAIVADGISSTTLVAGTGYVVYLTTTGTGTNTGAKYIVYQTAVSTWVAKLVSRQSSTSNNPSLAISGTTMVISHAHASTYTIQVLIERYSTGNTTLTSPFYFGIDSVLTYDGTTNIVSFGGNTLLNAGNYNSYAPTLTGTGASGTWGISISGNAATATSATSATSATTATTATTATNLSGGTVSATTGSFSGLLTPTGGISNGATFNNTGSAGEGGELHLQKGATSTLSGDLAFDLYNQSIRFFENGGTNRGAQLDISAQSASVGSTILTSTTSAASFPTLNQNTTGTAATATNIAGGTASQIPYQTGAGATSFIAAPTTSSTYLSWNGTAFAWTAVGGGATISDDTTTNATYYPTFLTATSGTLSTAKVASTKLTFNPSTGTLSSTAVSASSDERLKSNWQSVCDDFIERLSKVKHGTYDHVDSNVRQVGASAQGIQSFVPEGVDTDEHGMLSLAYGNVALVAAIKLSERLLAAEAKIAQLEELLKNKD